MVRFLRHPASLNLLPSLLLVGAALWPSAAHASSFIEVRVDAEDGAVVCLGDRSDASRFGGSTVVDGKAKLLIPRRSHGAKAANYLLTASDGERAARAYINAASDERRTTLKLGDANAGHCVPARAIQATDVPGIMTRFATKYRSEIMARTDRALVSDRFFDEFVDETERELDGLLAQAKGVSIVPDARLALLIDALSAAERRRETRRAAQRRRREVQRWADALEELARRRAERRRRAADERDAERRREQAEVEAKAEAERLEAAKQYCFGGVGQACGKFEVDAGVSWSRGIEFDTDIRASTCVPSGSGHSCWVNSGSWTHDECCVRHPNGHVCGGDDSSTACTDEWDRAVRRTASFFSWSDDFGPTPNTSGYVNFTDHCAAAGQLVEMPENSRDDNDYGFNDRELCCSKDARPLNPIEAGLLYPAHAVLFYIEPGEACK